MQQAGGVVCREQVHKLKEIWVQNKGAVIRDASAASESSGDEQVKENKPCLPRPAETLF